MGIANDLLTTIEHDFFNLSFPDAKVKWSKETPKEEGVYWMAYRDGERKVITLCEVFKLKQGTNSVTNARGETWIEGSNHGGPGLKRFMPKWQIDKSVRFGPKYKCALYDKKPS